MKEEEPMDGDHAEPSNSSGRRLGPTRSERRRGFIVAVLSISLGLGLLNVVPTGAMVSDESPPCEWTDWSTVGIVTGYAPEYVFKFKRDCYRNGVWDHSETKTVTQTIPPPDPSEPGKCAGRPWKLDRNGASATGSPVPTAITVTFYRSCPDGHGGSKWDYKEVTSNP
jgi:hypothetical protein